MAKHIGDVVVLLPGITGSVLRKNGRDVWAPTGGAILNALLTLGHDISDLKLGVDRPDVADLGDGITAPSLIPDIHLIPGLWKIDGYGKIRDWIRTSFDVEEAVNYFEFPYDWRRDNRVAAHRLQRESEGWLKSYRDNPRGNPQAKLILVGHSMGGLISRYFLECLEGWRDTRMLVTFGTPYRGSVKALGALSNGVERKIGPISVSLSELARSFTSIYQLLPIYKCFDGGDGDLVRVTETKAIPNLDAARAQAALDFHHEISTKVEEHLQDESYRQNRYEIRPVIGTFQPTAQSARLGPPGIVLVNARNNKDEDGDGTVPRISATPIEVEHEANAMYAAQQHASLQDDQAVLVQLDGLFTGTVLDASAVRALTPDVRLSLDMADAFVAAEPVEVRAKPETSTPEAIVATVESDGGEVARARLLLSDDGWFAATLPPLPFGTYRVTVSGGETVAAVKDVFAVFPSAG